MQVTDTKFPPGTIGIITGDLTRFAGFSISLQRLRVPANTHWVWMRGNGFASLRNQIISDMLTQPIKSEWLWFIDDDHEFEPDLLLNLLRRNVDMVQPLVSTRKPPFNPYAYRLNANGEFETPDWSAIPSCGLSKWDAIGTGGMLVKTEIIEAVGYPWFEEGKTFADAIGEDLYFCKKAGERGYSCFVDSDNRMGHITTTTVWPGQHKGDWVIDMDMLHNVRIRVPHDIGFSHLREAKIDPAFLAGKTT